jgi:hypothetical protein
MKSVGQQGQVGADCELAAEFLQSLLDHQSLWSTGCTMLQGPELDEERAATEMQFGGPRGAAGQWASCVRVIDPASASTTAVLELDENEVRCSRTTFCYGHLLPLVAALQQFVLSGEGDWQR